MNTFTDQQIEERQPSQSPPEYHPRWVFSFWSSLLQFTDPSHNPSSEDLTLLEVLRLTDSPPSVGLLRGCRSSQRKEVAP